jgi:hypothetical protein
MRYQLTYQIWSEKQPALRRLKIVKTVRAAPVPGFRVQGVTQCQNRAPGNAVWWLPIRSDPALMARLAIRSAHEQEAVPAHRAELRQ